MAAIKLRELCRRTRLRDGKVTYHYVDEKDGRTLVNVSESTYREWEALSVHTDTMYSRNDKLFQRSYKTIRFA